MKKYKNIKCLVLVVLLSCGVMFALSCDKDSLIPPVELHIDIVSIDVPEEIYTTENHPVSFVVEVNGAGLIEPGQVEVFGEVTGSDGTVLLEFRLYDNGLGGDVVAGDLNFTTTLNSSEFLDFGLTVTAIFWRTVSPDVNLGPGTYDPVSQTISISSGYPNAAPHIMNSSGISDTAFTDIGDYSTLQVDVFDDDGINDIATVEALVYFPLQSIPALTISMNDEGLSGDEVAADSTFSGQMEHAPLLANGNGEYTILYVATDLKGNRGELVQKFTAASGFVDTPPQIVQIIMPDSLVLDEVNGSVLYLQVEVFDVNGLNNISEVYAIFSASASQKHVIMYDDGDTNGYSRDLMAGDGIFSIIEPFPPDSPRGNYFYTFYVIDKENNIVTARHNFTIY